LAKAVTIVERVVEPPLNPSFGPQAMKSNNLEQRHQFLANRAAFPGLELAR
jgi:hypothetical protein